MEQRPPEVVSDTKAFKALTHPLRRRILEELSNGRRASATTLAAALGENTGATSYHLRILADAGVIEEDTSDTKGRERWWRQSRVTRKAPDYNTLDEEGKAAFDEWARMKADHELRLMRRYIDEYKELGEWAYSHRHGAHMTREDLNKFKEEFQDLLHKYSYNSETAPPDARPMAVRMFYLPTEPQVKGG